MIIFILILDLLLTFLPFLIIGLNYPAMSDKIPLFVNIMGEPVVLAGKNLFVAFRLPVMAVILQLICLVMYLTGRDSIKKTGKSTGLLRGFWIAASFTAAVKVSFSSLEYVGVFPSNFNHIFRMVVLGAALAGVIYLVLALVGLYRENGAETSGLFRFRMNGVGYLMVVLLAAYIFVTLFPLFTQSIVQK